MQETIRQAITNGPTLGKDGTSAFEFRFPADADVFAGHFPTRPLLPGVFQLEMTRIAAELLLQRPIRVREICKAKFLRPIIPEETVRVELKSLPETDTIQLRARFSVSGQAAGEALMKVTWTP